MGTLAADNLLARPISYHRIEDGVYAERRNLPEAQYIAQLVRELLRRETPQSLGIVAFSEAQQGEIETALEAWRRRTTTSPRASNANTCARTTTSSTACS